VNLITPLTKKHTASAIAYAMRVLLYWRQARGASDRKLNTHPCGAGEDWDFSV